MNFSNLSVSFLLFHHFGKKDTGYDLSLNKFLSLFCSVNFDHDILEIVHIVAEEVCIPGAAGLNVVSMTVRSIGANRQFQVQHFCV